MTKNDFDEKYKILEKVAEGGQGEVYRAQIVNKEMNFSREVAIKIFKKFSSSKEAVLNEIRILSMLRHPNICQIVETGELEESYFIVLEYVDGINLKNFRDV